MGSLGMPELLVILVIVIIVFGAGKLPQIGENLGAAIRNFKRSTQTREEADGIPHKVEQISAKNKE